MTRLSHTVHTALITALLTLASCGKGTPEKAGERLGEQRCTCDRIGQEEGLQRLAAELDLLTNEPTLTWDEVRVKVHDGYDQDPQSKEDHDARQERKKECKEVMKTLSNRILLDFPREDDRRVIENVVEAMERICDEENDAAREELVEKIQKIAEGRLHHDQ